MSTEIKIFKIDPSYYKVQNPNTNFRNSLYAMNVAIEQKFASEYYNNDFSRIIYARNNWALRQRAVGTNDTTGQLTNNLNLPFMNYKVSPRGATNNTARSWFNPTSNIEGVFIEELNRKLRINPIRFDYESTIWLYTDMDLQYVYQKLIFDNQVETRVPYVITIDGIDVSMPAVLSYRLEYDPVYDQEEWLKKNQIHSILLNFSIDTYYILDNVNISIPEKVLFEFAKGLNITEDNFVAEETYQLIVDRFTETNVEI